MRSVTIAIVLFAFAAPAHAEPRWEDVREAPTTEQLAAAEELSPVPWIEMPDARDFASVFPESRRSLVGGVSRGGERGSQQAGVRLACLIENDGRLACAATGVTDGDEVFVRPALMVATKFRVAPQTPEGATTTGRRVTRTIRFVRN